MKRYDRLSMNKAIKTVRAHKGHKKQHMGRVEGFISLLDATPSGRLMTDLQEELEHYKDKTEDIAAGL